jgi:hypothetical protein
LAFAFPPSADYALPRDGASLSRDDPLPLYRYRDGIAAVDRTVAHLDFFTWLADHPATFGAICAQFAIDPRPADVMLTLFTAMGLCTTAGGCFHLTLRAREHLVAASPWNLAPYYVSMKDRPQTLDMLKVLRTGKPANWGSYDPQAWAAAMERDDFAAAFTAAMDCRGMLLGQLAKRVDLSTHRALLDVAGGSGIYVRGGHSSARRCSRSRQSIGSRVNASAERSARTRSGSLSTCCERLAERFRSPSPANVLRLEQSTVRALLAKSHAALERRLAADP